MKFKECVDGLQKLLKERPETADYQVVTSHDDEKDFTEEQELNAVCVN